MGDVQFGEERKLSIRLSSLTIVVDDMKFKVVNTNVSQRNITFCGSRWNEHSQHFHQSMLGD